MTSWVSGKTGKIFMRCLCKSYEPMTDESFSRILFSKKTGTLFPVPAVQAHKTWLTLRKWEESLLQNNVLTYGKRWKRTLPRSKQKEHLK